MEPRYSLLVVDDDPELRQILTFILQRAGYIVTLASEGHEAIQCLQNTPFHLVFLDIMLPDADGMDLLPQIRALHPDTPVLLMTAHASLETAISAVRKGACDYLLKPIRREQLLRRTREILEEQAQLLRQKEIVGQLQSLLDELCEPHNGKDHPEKKGDPAPIPSERYLKRGNLTLDLYSRLAYLFENPIRMPPVTFDYLATLARYSPNPVSYETLVQETQGYGADSIDARKVAVWHIHAIRRALETNPHQPSLIVNVRNLGYRLVR
jgi:DNA-binding response OmpR family regulator